MKQTSYSYPSNFFSIFHVNFVGQLVAQITLNSFFAFL